MRIGVLDLGSNSFRLVVADVTAAGGFTVADREREMLHLGAVVGEHGHLPPHDVERSVKAAGRLATIARRVGAEELFCVATSALREATNGPEVVALIAKAVGSPVEVITGSREAELSYRGALASVLLPGTNRLLLDLGGGSLELAYGTTTDITHTISVKLGVSRVHALIGAPDILTPKHRDQIREHVRETLDPFELPDAPHQIIAVGGTMRALGEYIFQKQSSWIPLSLNQALLTRFEIEEATSRLSPLSAHDRIEIEQVKATRALHLPIAGVIISEILRLIGRQHLILSDWGLREGAAFDKLSIAPPTGTEVRDRSVQTLVDQFIPDSTHVNQTARVARSLMDQLEELLDLTELEQALVTVAARLHSVGRFISVSGSHRHTAYLVENASLRGFSPYDRAMLLSLLYSQRGGRTKTTFAPYMFLTHQQRGRVDRMGAVLQLSDSLDRTKGADLESVTAADDGEVIHLALQGDLDLPDKERLYKRIRFFEKMFSRTVEISHA